MPENTHIELIENVAERVPQEAKPAPDIEQLRRNAEELNKLLAWNPSVHRSDFFFARWRAMAAVKPSTATLRPSPRSTSSVRSSGKPYVS